MWVWLLVDGGYMRCGLFCLFWGCLLLIVVLLMIGVFVFVVFVIGNVLEWFVMCGFDDWFDV